MENKFKSKFGEKVSFLNSYDYSTKSIWYKIDCSCTSDDHSTIIEMEYDNEMNILSLHFYKDVSYSAWLFWKDDNIFGKFIDSLKIIKRRIVGAIKLIFTGHLEMSEEFILMSENHINDFIEALQEAKEFCKEDINNEKGIKENEN